MVQIENKHKVRINMPQMALGGLSESWLFKELGDLHWDLICKGLNTRSFDLKNDTEDRLYATFVRIRISASNSLQSFQENELGAFTGEIKRFGNSMYFSDIELNTNQEKIVVSMMTTFSIRNISDNTKLAKSEPGGLRNDVTETERMPKFGNEYRMVKKQKLKALVFDDLSFAIQDEFLFEYEYTLNPFYDINGVNLLYFAAYPIINDFCEMMYFNQEKRFTECWEQDFSTQYKDVLYYANCNLSDKILYQLIDVEAISEDKIKISSILRRVSDGNIIARIFSVKVRTNNQHS